MIDNYFMDGAIAPGPESIAEALGRALPWYEGILAAADGFEREWKHYGKKYGWKLKVHDGEKTLLELTLAGGAFRVGMAAREGEARALREGELARSLEGLMDTQKAREGWGIRAMVDTAERYESVRALVAAIAAMRSKV